MKNRLHEYEFDDQDKYVVMWFYSSHQQQQIPRKNELIVDENKRKEYLIFYIKKTRITPTKKSTGWFMIKNCCWCTWKNQLIFNNLFLKLLSNVWQTDGQYFPVCLRNQIRIVLNEKKNIIRTDWW
jgi:hypothetical protein